jgi:hypothetical protein
MDAVCGSTFSVAPAQRSLLLEDVPPKAEFFAGAVSLPATGSTVPFRPRHL